MYIYINISITYIYVFITILQILLHCFFMGYVELFIYIWLCFVLKKSIFIYYTVERKIYSLLIKKQIKIKQENKKKKRRMRKTYL